MNKKDIAKHYISTECKIKLAIKKMGNLNVNNFCLVLGKQKNILGTITDGDIRRGLLKNYNIDEKVEKIYQRRPVVTKKILTKKEIESILNKNNITFLPLLNKKNKVLPYKINGYYL